MILGFIEQKKGVFYFDKPIFAPHNGLLPPPTFQAEKETLPYL